MTSFKNHLYLLIFLRVCGYSQSTDTLFQKALQYKSENKFRESLSLFQQLLKTDSTQVDYLTNTAFLLCKAGNTETSEEKRQHYFHLAYDLAEKAVVLNNQNAQAHYTKALALGRINEFASTKQKIANAKTIKTECERAIRLDPNLAGAYHILGRWHKTVAEFNFLEKAMINAMYGGVPQGGSLDEAIRCFSIATRLEPSYNLHYYELANCYHERGNKDDDTYAKAWLNEAIKITARDKDELETRKKCIELLKKLN